MMLKIDILFCVCLFSVFADINITTMNNGKQSLHENGMNIQNSTSIYVMVKACLGVSIGLLDKNSNVENQVYHVFFGKTRIIIENQTKYVWSGLNCFCYVALWVSWIDGKIEAGFGNKIGADAVISASVQSSNSEDLLITDIFLWSFVAADWLFDFPENSIPACTPDPTTKSNITTTKGLDPTTISRTITSQGLNSITISNATTTGFHPATTTTTTTTTTTPTSRTTPIVETTERSPTKTPCSCPCYNYTLTEDDLNRKIALLKSELYVDPKPTNKYRRSLTSASDDRPSSKYIGTFGIVVLVVICTLIYLMDF